MKTINENTTAVITVEFRDEDGGTIAPDSASYRLDDESGAELITDTGIVAPTSMVSIEIPESANAIVDSNKMSEKKYLTLSYTYAGDTRQAVSEYSYEVRNLRFYPSPVTPP